MQLALAKTIKNRLTNRFQCNNLQLTKSTLPSQFMFRGWLGNERGC